MATNTGKDGALTAVDGRLFHSGISCINKTGLKVVCHTMGLPGTGGITKRKFHHGREKRLNYTGSYKKGKEFKQTLLQTIMPVKKQLVLRPKAEF